MVNATVLVFAPAFKSYLCYFPSKKSCVQAYVVYIIIVSFLTTPVCSKKKLCKRTSDFEDGEEDFEQL